MRLFTQKLALSEDISFVARTFRTPDFEVNWHQHIELELILFTEGEGMSYVGNYVGDFKKGDVFFLGANLPHTFQKRHKDNIVSAVVVQFRDDFWGKEFIGVPESRQIKHLFETAKHGLKIHGLSKIKLNSLVRELEHLCGFKRLLNLCECLDIIASKEEYSNLSSQNLQELDHKNKERIDCIFQFTIDNFKSQVKITEIAKLINMSVPTFCRYFKKCTKKTYIDFLNEVRIGNACKLLMDTQLNINEICYESGYNTLANFNSQFMRIKRVTPSKYRKAIIESLIAEPV